MSGSVSNSGVLLSEEISQFDVNGFLLTQDGTDGSAALKRRTSFTPLAGTRSTTGTMTRQINQTPMTTTTIYTYDPASMRLIKEVVAGEETIYDYGSGGNEANRLQRVKRKLSSGGSEVTIRRMAYDADGTALPPSIDRPIPAAMRCDLTA